MAKQIDPTPTDEAPWIPMNNPRCCALVAYRVVSKPDDHITATEYKLSDEVKRALTLPPGVTLGEKVEPGPVDEEFESALRGCGASDGFLRAIQRDRERWGGRRHGFVGFVRWALDI